MPNFAEIKVTLEGLLKSFGAGLITMGIIMAIIAICNFIFEILHIFPPVKIAPFFFVMMIALISSGIYLRKLSKKM